MDYEDEGAQHRLMDLGEAIKAALADAGLNQQWLARKLQLDDGQLSRILNGRSPKLALHMVTRIEDSIGVRRGALLRAGGYVDLDGLATRDVIATAPELSVADRAALLRLYDTWADTSAPAAEPVSSSADGSSNAPTPPRSRRR